MPGAPLPQNEVQRLKALRQCAVLDTEAERAFDDLTRLASELCDAPIALVSLVDEARQWFKSRVGLDAYETPREQALCGYTILGDDPFVIEDASTDPRTCDNPFVTGEINLRFYAGFPLKLSTGERLGSLCVIDTKPRGITPTQLANLEALARQASSQLELRREWAIARDHLEASREARRKLADLQGRFERAVTGATEGLWEYNPGTGCIWYSEQFKRLLGLASPEYDDFEPVFESFVDRLHPNDKERILDAINAHLRGEAPYDVTHRLRHNDGAYRWFRARGRATRDDQGEIAYVSGSLTDIHDQHTLENRLQLAVRAAGIGLWDWDIPTGETYFSDTFYTMLGYEPGELPMGLDTWKTLAHQEDFQGAIDDINRHFKGETPYYINEHRLRTKSGEYLWIRDVGQVVEWDEHDEPNRMIGVHVNLDEQMRARKSLEHLNDELRARTEYANDMADKAHAASKAKSEFLANMSHEIRTPMTAILGYADILEEKDNAQNPEAIRSIRSNARHLLAIINDILDMSRIEAGRLAVDRRRVDPIAIVRESLELIAHRAEERGLTLRTLCRTPLPDAISTDPTRLRQILLNLVSNAIKFTDEGGITIHVECEPDERRIRFRVRDTGVGLTNEQLETVLRFEVFSQVDYSSTRNHGGTGLGLRISNALAQALGGGIDVTSTRDEGSEFTVTIETGDLEGATFRDTRELQSAIDQPGAGVPPENASRDSSRDRKLQGVRILIAEDSPDNQRLFTHHLVRAGADVQLVDNGVEAIRQIERHSSEAQPNLVLMDMQMPKLDGYSATKALRQQGFTAPIIALTAHAMEEDKRKCLNAGCDRYLSKPIKAEALVRACHDALQAHAGRRDAA